MSTAMNIILVFPKAETLKNLRNVLRRAGYQVDACVTTVAQALHAAGGCDGGIIITYYRLIDGMATEICENAGERFQYLVIGPKDYVEARTLRDVFSLTTPLCVGELLSTMEVMSCAWARWRKKLRSRPRVRSKEEQRTLDRAKLLLMEQNALTEEEAHRYIQKTSMDSGIGMVETAYMILSLMSERN